MALHWVLKDEEELKRQTERHTHKKNKKRSGRGDRIGNGTEVWYRETCRV